VTGSTRPQLVTCSWSAYRREMGAYVRISLGVPRVKLPDPRYTERRHYVYVSELAPRREYFHAPADEFARRYVDQLRLYADDIDRKLAAIPPEHGAICPSAGSVGSPARSAIGGSRRASWRTATA
jgi:hypothetical protein